MNQQVQILRVSRDCSRHGRAQSSAFGRVDRPRQHDSLCACEPTSLGRQFQALCQHVGCAPVGFMLHALFLSRRCAWGAESGVVGSPPPVSAAQAAVPTDLCQAGWEHMVDQDASGRRPSDRQRALSEASEARVAQEKYYGHGSHAAEVPWGRSGCSPAGWTMPRARAV